MVEKYSEHAFIGTAFCLGSDGGRGQSKSSLGKNKPCDQMAGAKALGLEVGFCLNGFSSSRILFGHFLGSRCSREGKEPDVAVSR